MNRKIDDMIAEKYQREAVTDETPMGQAARLAARIERRCLLKAKRELVARGDLPDTPDPVKPEPESERRVR